MIIMVTIAYLLLFSYQVGTNTFRTRQCMYFLFHRLDFGVLVYNSFQACLFPVLLRFQTDILTNPPSFHNQAKFISKYALKQQTNSQMN